MVRSLPPTYRSTVFMRSAIARIRRVRTRAARRYSTAETNCFSRKVGGQVLSPSVTWRRVKSSKTAADSTLSIRLMAPAGMVRRQRDRDERHAQFLEDPELVAGVVGPVVAMDEPDAEAADLAAVGPGERAVDRRDVESPVRPVDRVEDRARCPPPTG